MLQEKTIKLLRELKLKTFIESFDSIEKKAIKSDWTYESCLEELCLLETDYRTERRIARLIKQSRIPINYSLETLDQKLLSSKVRKTLQGLLSGDFVKQASNVLAFGLPGRGKTHFLCALGRELILKHNMTVYFTETFKLVEKLLIAKKNYELEISLKKLDKFDVIILDDIGYVQQSRDEMEVLFTFLSERYERKSLMISSNLVFSKWNEIFKDPMTTMAAVDRLVHHSSIIEFKGPSLRAKIAKEKMNYAHPDR